MNVPPFGPELHADGITFRLWAPAARRVELVRDGTQPMQQSGDGWYEATVPGIGAGALYKFRIDGELEVPDPASHFQPQDIPGPSEVIDHSDFAWRAAGWQGRPWEESRASY